MEIKIHDKDYLYENVKDNSFICMLPIICLCNSLRYVFPNPPFPVLAVGTCTNRTLLSLLVGSNTVAKISAWSNF